MVRGVAGVAIAGLLAAGCARKRDAAPEDLDGLSHYLFENWEDEELVLEGMSNLAPWLLEEGAGPEAWDGYVLTDLRAEEVDDVDYPANINLSDHIGVAVSGESAHPVLDHAGLLVLTDQTWNEPDTYTRYVRTVAGDSEAFAAGTGLIRTVNDIEKGGAFGVSIPYELNKDYRWVHLDDGTSAVLGRSWVSEMGCSDNGKNCVVQSFSIDLFYGRDDRHTVRLMSGWNEVKTEVDGLVGEDLLIAMMVSGNQEIYEATEDKLDTD